MATSGLTPCPLGNGCLSNTTIGHEPGSNELAACMRAARSTSKPVEGSSFNPDGSYKPSTKKAKDIERQVRAAWGSSGTGIPNLIGPPGIGKTSFVENLARSMHADYIVLDVSSADPDIFNGIPCPPHVEEGDEVYVDGKGRVKIADRLYELDVVKMFFRDPKKPAVIMLDEINGGKPELLSSLQKILTSRTLAQEDVKLNDNVFIIAAMNDAAHTSNGRDLAAAVTSRTSNIKFEPDFDDWVNGELTFWGKGYDSKRAAEVASVFGDRPADAEDHLYAASLVASYLDEMGHPRSVGGSNSATVNLFLQPIDESDPSRKVADPRGWSSVISSIAYEWANRDPNEPDAFTVQCHRVISNRCGSEAARDFVSFHETRRELPDMKSAFSKGTLGGFPQQWREAGRSDVALYATAVLANRDHGGDLDNVVTAVKLMSEVCNSFPDIAAPALVSAVRKWQGQSQEGAFGDGSNGTAKLYASLAPLIQGNEVLAKALRGVSASAHQEEGGDLAGAVVRAKGAANAARTP